MSTVETFMGIAAYKNQSPSQNASGQRCGSEFFRQYFPALAGFAGKIIPDRLAAQDIATDVLIKYWHRQDDFTDAEKVKSFLYLCTKNACLNYIKKRKREEKLWQIFEDITVETDHYFLRDIIRVEVTTQLVEIAKRLPPGCRRIIYLYYCKELSYEEVANQLEISVRTVRNQIAIGITKLRAQSNLLTAG